MINITERKDCCGCEACGQVCPQNCISYHKDSEGFLYPKVDKSRCINCGLCERVCPQLNFNERRNPILTLGAIYPDYLIRKESSSGGVFTALALTVLSKGGIIYGACFTDNWVVIHNSANTVQELSKLRTSKYVQSQIGKAFIEVKDHLQKHKIVMFTGTPCQIYGLKKFLKKDYSNLLLVEVACHGVPSPKAWSAYLAHFEHKGVIQYISFRDKSYGWENYKLTIKYKSKRTSYSNRSIYDPYLCCFLRHLTIRPSCFYCKSKNGRSGADILLGDLWGCEKLAPTLDDHKGASLILVYSEKGEEYIQNCGVFYTKIDYAEVVKFNPVILKSINKPDERDKFWESFNHNSNGYNVIKEYGRPLAPSKYISFKTYMANIFNHIRILCKVKSK